MRDKLSVLWERIRIGLWPLPLSMLALAMLVFAATLHIDRGLSGNTLPQVWWLNSGSGGDARTLLSTLVTAIITMSSVVFSITIVALSLAANQFGSRLVRTYMADIRTKLALGLFLTTVVYSLLGLRYVQEGMTPAEVPQLTVSVGLLLGLICVLALLLFLHVIARSIIADEVVARVAGELEDSIGALPDLDSGQPPSAHGPAATDDLDGNAAKITSTREGYVQAVNYGRLAEVACRHAVVLRLGFKTGDFMCRGGWLGTVHPGVREHPELASCVRKEILIGRERTPTQDLEFSIRHLVDIALRALSPAINDANTAMVVIDRLRGAMSNLMGKRLAQAEHFDSSGQLRVIAKCDDYAGILEFAFQQIRHAGQAQPAVMLALLESFCKLAEHVRLETQARAILLQVRLATEAALLSSRMSEDCRKIADARAAAELRIDQVLSGLNNRGIPAITGETLPRAPGAMKNRSYSE